MQVKASVWTIFQAKFQWLIQGHAHNKDKGQGQGQHFIKLMVKVYSKLGARRYINVKV